MNGVVGKSGTIDKGSQAISMNVLMVTRAVPQHGGGGMEAVAWELAQALGRLGLNVTILTSAHRSLPVDGNIGGVAIRTVPARHNRYTSEWWQGTRAAFSGGLRDWADIVLSVSAGANALVSLRSITRRQPFIFQAHGTSLGEMVSKLRSGSPKSMFLSLANLYSFAVKEWCYRDYDTVVAVGDTVNLQLTKGITRILVGQTPVVRIRNGIDLASFSFDSQSREAIRAKYGFRDDDIVLLSVGRLHKQKGVHLALKALAAASQRKPNLRYLIVGEGPLRAELERLISKYNLLGKVVLAGNIEKGAAKGYYSAGDTFVFPSIRVEAGMTLSVMEALASGLPVIGFGEASAGYPMLKRGDVGQLTRAIFEARPPRDRNSKLDAEYDINTSAHAYAELFSHLLARRSS